MSERKVLNKYYPPDFDPSKVPKSKEKRNATFEIRLMAPCNMRCTTCGEYIYKGRKFNARKEDVDDMNYLGLRIYRFYIKCTACVSEICFRTDPATTDYIIEVGILRIIAGNLNNTALRYYRLVLRGILRHSGRRRR